MWGSPAICEGELYSIAKGGLRGLPRAIFAIGWFGLNVLDGCSWNNPGETDQTVATGEEGRLDRTGKSDLGGFVISVGRLGGALSVA
jgi:hypothetical protein